MPNRIYKHEDNVAAQLDAGISAATTSIAVKAGEGAQFPQPYNGTTTSGGTNVALNATSIGASGVAVGDIIENATDGSYAVVTTVNTNDLVTTPLRGGTDNTWDSGDEWRVNTFVATFIQYDTDGVTILKREKALIIGRSTDTLTVATGGRGFDGSSGQSFNADDYVYQFSVAQSFDGLADAFSVAVQYISENATEVATKLSVDSSEIYAADGGSTDAYAVTLSPAPASYTTGLEVNFYAATINTGEATLDVNGLGAKIIKKADGATTLANGDIAAGQLVKVLYNGTDFQMMSPVANEPPTEYQTTERTHTAGQDILGGRVVAIEADGDMNVLRPLSIDSLSSSTTYNATAYSARGHKHFYRISQTQVLFIVPYNTGGNSFLAFLEVVVDPTDGSITSNTLTNVQANAGGSAIGIDPKKWDFEMLDASTGIVVYEYGATVYGCIISSIGTGAAGVTVGSEQNLGSARTAAGVGVFALDASNAVMIKHTSATGLQSVDLAISGSTITAGTVDTFVSDASNNLNVRDVVSYGSYDADENWVANGYYAVIYENDTGNTDHVIIGEWDDVTTNTFSSVGSAAAISNAQYECQGRRVSETCIVIQHVNSSTGNCYVTTVTRDATTGATVNSSTALTTAISNANPSIEMFSSHHGAVGWTVAPNTRYRVQFFEIDMDAEDTVTMIDTYLEAGSNNYHDAVVGLISPTHAIILFDGGGDKIAPLNFTDNFDGMAGVLQATVLDAGSERITLNGYEDGMSGMTTGTRYRARYSGQLTSETAANGWPEVGLAISATEMYIKD